MTTTIKQMEKENLYLCMTEDESGLYVITLAEYGKTVYRYETMNRKNALAAYNRTMKKEGLNNKKNKNLYPGIREAEKERSKGNKNMINEPDFIGNAPNYDKFKGWTVEKTLSWLNID